MPDSNEKNVGVFRADPEASMVPMLPQMASDKAKEKINEVFGDESAVTANFPIPIEWTLQLAIDRQIPVGYGLNVVSLHQIPDEWTQGLAIDRQIPIEWEAQLALDHQIPVEWDTVMTPSDHQIPVEWNTVITPSDHQIPIAWVQPRASA